MREAAPFDENQRARCEQNGNRQAFASPPAVRARLA
jgi:hypothetical protein